MFGWFQRLLPRKSDFFGMFEAHAATLVAAAEAMDKLVDGGPRKEEIAEVERREHEADDIIRQVLTDVRAHLSHALRPRRDHISDRGDGRRDRRNALGCRRNRPL